MFVEDGFHGVGLEDLARRAGVGRKTIYYQFGSKLGLLESLVADLGERGAVGDFVAAEQREQAGEEISHRPLVPARGLVVGQELAPVA